MWEWLLRRAEAEAHVVKGAPVAFVIMACVVAALTFLIVDWHFAGEIDTLKDRTGTLEASDKWHAEQLAEYQRVFPGRSTDEAVKEITSLRADVTKTQQQLSKLVEIHPRILSDQEKTKLTEALMNFPRTNLTLMVSWVIDSHGESYHYA
jgi:hypothetical protein